MSFSDSFWEAFRLNIHKVLDERSRAPQDREVQASVSSPQLELPAAVKPPPVAESMSPNETKEEHLQEDHVMHPKKNVLPLGRSTSATNLRKTQRGTPYARGGGSRDRLVDIDGIKYVSVKKIGKNTNIRTIDGKLYAVFDANHSKQ